ncbi:hypothetical protein PKCEKB_PKCEKB_12845, partial [Dysosmobacter welbionis]
PTTPSTWSPKRPSTASAIKIFPDNEGRDGGCRLSFFPFATRFLSSIHRTFLCIFVQYTQKYNEIKNILWAFFLRLRIDFPKESRYNWKQ